MVQNVPASKIAVVDTLAAGDAFHGAFALALLEDEDAARPRRSKCACFRRLPVRSPGTLGGRDFLVPRRTLRRARLQKSNPRVSFTSPIRHHTARSRQPRTRAMKKTFILCLLTGLAGFVLPPAHAAPS
ncbi:MAG: PfkB family carbohydrate kinase, partial [Candidatus Accumulibacter sp.]|nr:PfkB family carbohydrate kinase [Accumulibacter sp.]